MKKILLFVFAIVLLSSCSISTDFNKFSESEKSMFITIEDLNEFLEVKYQIKTEKAEVFNLNIPIGALKIYNYDMEYAEERGQFFINNSIIISEKFSSKKKNEAEKYIKAFEKENLQPVKISVLDDINAEIYILNYNGNPGGNFISYHTGSITGAVTISGIYFDEENLYLLENLLRRKIENIKQQ